VFFKNTGHFVKSDLDCIRKRIFLMALFQKERFLAMHLVFVLFSLQFHEAPTLVGLKMFRTVRGEFSFSGP